MDTHLRNLYTNANLCIAIFNDRQLYEQILRSDIYPLRCGLGENFLTSTLDGQDWCPQTVTPLKLSVSIAQFTQKLTYVASFSQCMLSSHRRDPQTSVFRQKHALHYLTCHLGLRRVTNTLTIIDWQQPL